MDKITITIARADVGGFIGNSNVHPALIDTIESIIEEKKSELINDYYITNVGDDIILILHHNNGEKNINIHKLIYDSFIKASNVAKELGLHDAGEDIIAEFKDNLYGTGISSLEITITPRKSEPIIIFAADKTDVGAFNYPLFKMFADPFNTSGLVIDPKMHDGFIFEIVDVYENKKILLKSPEEMYDILALIGSIEKYAIRRVFPKNKNTLPEGEPAAAASIEKINLIAGRYVGKSDPTMIVRCQSGLPAVGEVLEAFSFPYLVPGWMRGAHWSPLLPVSQKNAKATRFDGPSRVIGLGFQIKKDKLVGPEDMFDDIAFEHVYKEGLKISDYIRRHGPFEPERLSLEYMKETRFPQVLEKLKGRFEPLE